MKISKVAKAAKDKITKAVKTKITQAVKSQAAISAGLISKGRERLNELEMTRRFEVLKSYITGKDFEADLDEIISSLQLEKMGAPVNFSDISGRKKRIAAKVAYLRNQAGMVIGFCGTAGAKVGAKLGRGNVAIIADGAIAGSTVGFVIVGFFAGRVFLKRYQSAGAIDIQKLELALEPAQ